MNKKDPTFSQPCFPSTAELLELLTPPRKEWKQKVRDLGSQYSAAFIAPIDCIDSDVQPFLDCHCRDNAHLRFNIEKFLSHGFHPVVIISQGKSLELKKIDSVKAKALSTFEEGSVSYSKATLQVQPCLAELQKMGAKKQ